MLRRSPGFTSVAVLSLALGIGANTAMSTVIYAVMIRSLPVRSPDQLVSVGDASRPTAMWSGAPMANIFSYPLYRRIREQNRVFSGLLASGKAQDTDVVIGKGSSEEARCRMVSDNYFDVLGVSPMLGRTFSPQENSAAGANPAIIISYDYWTNRLGRDPNVLGTTLRINGFPYPVIGVGPPRFSGEVVGSPTDIWIPIAMQPQVNLGEGRLDNHDANWLLCIGRLRPGVSIGAARAEVTALVQEALIDYQGAAMSPDALREIRSQTVAVQPGGKGFSWIRTHDSTMLFALMAMVGLVLLIACTNVATLSLVRGASRHKELSMRLALGASRRRVIRQLLTESALLAAIAGVAGFFFAEWGGRVLARLAAVSGGSNPIPFQVDVHPNLAVLAFTAGVSVLTAVVFGLLPALRSTNVDLTPALKENARSLGHGKWGMGKLLVIAQLALSVMLLIAAGLFVRSIGHLDVLDVGYSRHNLLVLGVDLAASGYQPTQRLPTVLGLIEQLRSIPGVLAATVSQNGIFSGTNSNTDSLQVEGFAPVRKEDLASEFDQVGPYYFRVIGVPILRGRDFNEYDTARSSAVAIINETMARFYFGKSDPLGKYFANGGDRYTIVGVASDMKERDLKGKAERRFYLPLFQTSDTIATFHFEIRTRAEGSQFMEAVRRKLQSFNSELRLQGLQPVSVLIDRSVRGDRTIAQVSGFFGLLVLLLAANGLYGVISYITSRRTNEIGIRMAVGADRGAVIYMVLGETLTLMGAGLALGIPAALAVTRLISSMLSGVSASDPSTIAAVASLMVLVGALAGFIPAIRASRIDPMTALRQE